MLSKIVGGTIFITALVLTSVGLVTAAPSMHAPAGVAGAAALAMTAATYEYYCTTETFPDIVTDVYLGKVGKLNFGAGNFAGFVQADWIYATGSALWPDCADAVVWMPAAGQIVSTDQPLTRTITFDCNDCRLTQITLAAHKCIDGFEPETGVVRVRALDKYGNRTGESIESQLNYTDGCVTFDTNFTKNHAAIEISYTRGSELGIIDMSYCCQPVPPDNTSCSAAFWAQSKNFEHWQGYIPEDDFDTIFGIDLFNPDVTLIRALKCNSSGVNRLARNGVACLLNASNPDVFYPFTVDEVIALVQEGNADSLEKANSLKCPFVGNDNDHGNDSRKSYTNHRGYRYRNSYNTYHRRHH